MSDFKKAYAGEAMATPRAKTPSNARVDQVQIQGLGHTIPVLRDQNNQVVMQSMCVPNGATHKVRPQMGVSLPYVAPNGLDFRQNMKVTAATTVRTVPR